METVIVEIGGKEFAEMTFSAAAAIEKQRQPVNELNVFPVPDGDTGTNMSLTMGSAVVELAKGVPEEAGQAAEVVAQALLRGARGNSGVILSLLFRGVAKSARGARVLSGPGLADALSQGVDAAYRAVMKPAEGTILTVSGMAARRAAAAAGEDTAFEYVLAQALEAAEAALAETVHQNPVLAKAGVIDAGAKGFCIILEGMLRALRGEPYTAGAVTEGLPQASADFAAFSDKDIEYAYCTEFIVGRRGRKEVLKLHAFLGSLGDSLVFVDDESIIKVHVHTNNPGKALEAALAYGDLTSVKIENMRQQHTAKVILDPAAARSVKLPVRRYGFVAVCAGEGLTAIFRDMGADAVISGGQTMNPSTEDILAGIDATPAEIVYVLPNNKNIIMAAELAVPLSEKQVVVLPTRSVPEGLAALLAFNAPAEPEENREAMTQAFSRVSTGMIACAARDAQFDGRGIREGDYMALLDGQLLCSHRERGEVVRRLAQALAARGPVYVTLFSGKDGSREDLQSVREVFMKAVPEAEINLLDGGQPVYELIVSAE